MQPITNLIVGVELNESDEHVLACALDFAKLLGASVHVLHARGDAVPAEAAALHTPAAEALKHKLAEHAARIDAKLAAFAAAHRNVHVETMHGRPFEALIAAADQRKGSLIIVGAGRMQGGFFERLMGSTSSELLSAATCPVLIVPRHAAPVALTGRSLIVAVDGSDAAARAVSLALNIGARFDDRVIPVHASYAPDARESIHNWFAGQTRPEVRGLESKLVFVEEHPTKALLDQVEANHAAMIVMGSHAKGALARIVVGSVASQTIQESNVPVLLVR
jgi:nucleotide-binding universal stress UspA family protein